MDTYANSRTIVARHPQLCSRLTVHSCQAGLFSLTSSCSSSSAKCSTSCWRLSAKLSTTTSSSSRQTPDHPPTRQGLLHISWQFSWQKTLWPKYWVSPFAVLMPSFCCIIHVGIAQTSPKKFRTGCVTPQIVFPSQN